MGLKLEFNPSREQLAEGSAPRRIEFLRTKTQAIPQFYKNKVPSHSHSARLGVITPPPALQGGSCLHVIKQ